MRFFAYLGPAPAGTGVENDPLELHIYRYATRARGVCMCSDSYRDIYIIALKLQLQRSHKI